MQRLGLTEFIVGTGVVRAIALGQAHQFRQFGDKLFAAVELPKVEIRAGRGREGHLAHVRGRSVDVGDLPRRDIHAVDGVRIAGAEDVFHVQPCVLRRAHVIADQRQLQHHNLPNGRVVFDQQKVCHAALPPFTLDSILEIAQKRYGSRFPSSLSYHIFFLLRVTKL